MKKVLYTIMLSIIISATAMAQGGAKIRQRIEVAKIAFLTQRLDLGTDEAQQFWPVYNNYQKEAEDLIKQRSIAKNAANQSSEPDYELDFRGRMVDLQKRYSQQFLKVLPRQKAIQVFRAEREFRQNLIKELGNRRTTAAAVPKNN